MSREQISQKYFYCYPYKRCTAVKDLYPLYGSLSISTKSARSWEADRLSPFVKKFKVPPSKREADGTPNINSRGETFDEKRKKQSLPLYIACPVTFISISHTPASTVDRYRRSVGPIRPPPSAARTKESLTLVPKPRQQLGILKR